ncbi:unnamed protein product [Protopolystoma xenopodis]|uniref:Uncharacterized protein n=1 Tax=Protopolystoma xenopodis TaxID=117903 RepID=A0A3S5A9R9_9PLAT|nr:unnamed protein product [Protopolystoma xenopodis]
MVGFFHNHTQTVSPPKRVSHPAWAAGSTPPPHHITASERDSSPGPMCTLAAYCDYTPQPWLPERHRKECNI